MLGAFSGAFVEGVGKLSLVGLGGTVCFCTITYKMSVQFLSERDGSENVLT